MTNFKKIFWDDDIPKNIDLHGGMFYRSMKMGEFIKNCEEKGYKICGIRLDETNNCEFIFIPPEGV
jgi:hypothetical protein